MLALMAGRRRILKGLVTCQFIGRRKAAG
jgi:hypothetical protein